MYHDEEQLTSRRRRRRESGSQSIAAVERAIDVLLLFGRSNRADLGVTEISGELGLVQGRGPPDPHVAAQPRPHRRRRRQPPLLPRAGSAGARPRLPRTHRRALHGLLGAGLALGNSRRRPPRSRSATATPGCTSTRSFRTARSAWRSRSACRTRCTPERRRRPSSRSSPTRRSTPTSRATSSAAMTEQTITDDERLRRDLAAIRKRGYATSAGERMAGAASVAAPVLDHDGAAGRRRLGQRPGRAVQGRDG